MIVLISKKLVRKLRTVAKIEYLVLGQLGFDSGPSFALSCVA